MSRVAPKDQPGSGLPRCQPLRQQDLSCRKASYKYAALNQSPVSCILALHRPSGFSIILKPLLIGAGSLYKLDKYPPPRTPINWRSGT